MSWRAFAVLGAIACRGESVPVPAPSTEVAPPPPAPAHDATPGANNETATMARSDVGRSTAGSGEVVSPIAGPPDGEPGRSRGAKIVRGKTAVVGNLEPAAIQRVLARREPQIAFCYDKVLVDMPALHASVVVRFTIGSTGKVTQSSAQLTGGVPELEACLTRTFSAMQFPAPKGGGTVDVIQPLRFSPPA